MLSILMLVVFSLATLFFIGFIVENATYAKRSIALEDTACIIRAVGAIIVSALAVTALWLQAGYYFFFA